MNFDLESPIDLPNNQGGRFALDWHLNCPSGCPRAYTQGASVSLTNRRFEIPEDFDFEAFTRTAFNMIWGETQEVKIRFSASQAPYIRERTWHPRQKIETEPDGSIILTLKVADLGEVKFWLIGFGVEAEVLEPAELRDDVKAECLGVVQRVNPMRGGGA